MCWICSSDWLSLHALFFPPALNVGYPLTHVRRSLFIRMKRAGLRFHWHLVAGRHSQPAHWLTSPRISLESTGRERPTVELTDGTYVSRSEFDTAVAACLVSASKAHKTQLHHGPWDAQRRAGVWLFRAAHVPEGNVSRLISVSSERRLHQIGYVMLHSRRKHSSTVFIKGKWI